MQIRQELNTGFRKALLFALIFNQFKCNCQLWYKENFFHAKEPQSAMHTPARIHRSWKCMLNNGEAFAENPTKSSSRNVHAVKWFGSQAPTQMPLVSFQFKWGNSWIMLLTGHSPILMPQPRKIDGYLQTCLLLIFQSNSFELAMAPLNIGHINVGEST